MRHQGKLRSWNDERGFGFIAPTGGGEEVFVHVSALPRDGSRPMLGEDLSYELGRNAEGKVQAQRVQRLALAPASRAEARRAAAPPPAPKAAGAETLLVLPVFLLLYLGLASVGELPRWLPWVYAGMSLLCFLVYGFDKAAASAGRWRTAESTLHLLALAGGWPGALLAQQLLRHKSKKAEFRVVFWMTVALNLGLLTALALGWLPVRR